MTRGADVKVWTSKGATDITTTSRTTATSRVLVFSRPGGQDHHNMFEPFKLRLATPRRIALQTRDGWEIANEIRPESTEMAHKKFELLVNRAGVRWEVRKPPTAGYNCAGHVFACRRTGIYGGGEDGVPGFEELVAEILERDGYRRFTHHRGDPAHAGDVVLYWDSDKARRLLLHVGMVCEVRKMIADIATLGDPYVLSKWDDSSGECLHHFRHVPFEDGDFTVEFWTDRPSAGGTK